MDFSPLFAKLLTFIALMLAGYAGARKNILCPGFAKSLSWLVMDVFLSCTILNSVTSGDLDISGAQLIKVILMLSLVMLISYALGALTSRILFKGRENTPVFELLISVMNNIFIGLPIAEALYGATAVLYCALSCIPYNLLLYSYGVWRLRSGKAIGNGSSAFKIKDVFTVPLFATLAALLIFIFNIQLPYILRELISRFHDRHRRDARQHKDRRRLQRALCVPDKPDASYRHSSRGMVRRRLTEHGRHARGDLHDNRGLPERRSRVHPRAAE